MSNIKDIALAPSGELKIDWVKRNMPAAAHAGGRIRRGEAVRRPAHRAVGASGGENGLPLPRAGRRRRGNVHHRLQPPLHAGRRGRRARAGRAGGVRRLRLAPRPSTKRNIRAVLARRLQHHHRRRRRSGGHAARGAARKAAIRPRRMRGDDDRHHPPEGDGGEGGSCASR